MSDGGLETLLACSRPGKKEAALPLLRWGAIFAEPGPEPEALQTKLRDGRSFSAHRLEGPLSWA